MATTAAADVYGFRIHRIESRSWQDRYAAAQQREAAVTLESGGLIFLPHLNFTVEAPELPLLRPGAVRPKSKNVVFDRSTGRLGGVELPAQQSEALRNMLRRYVQASVNLVTALLPDYAPRMRVARTSFRPIEASDRVTSWRKDDRRLHVDAFPSTPNQGQRLLRVFSNVNPDGRDRVWSVGEAFETVARRFLPSIRPGPAAYRHVLRLIGITHGLRTEYDQIMLDLHDHMKADPSYQRTAASRQLPLPSGSTWIVQTDAVSHAALSGRFMLEQTFLVPLDAMLDPDRSPLRILERMTGRALA